jgi:hypothetical protein
MNLAQKLTYAKVAVESISRHADEDADVRLAILRSLVAHIDHECNVISAEVRRRIMQLSEEQA